MNHHQIAQSGQGAQSDPEVPAWVHFPTLEALSSPEGRALVRRVRDNARELEILAQTGTASSTTRALAILMAYRRALEIIDSAGMASEEKDLHR
jgi:hypothetical protein